MKTLVDTAPVANGLARALCHVTLGLLAGAVLFDVAVGTHAVRVDGRFERQRWRYDDGFTMKIECCLNDSE